MPVVPELANGLRRGARQGILSQAEQGSEHKTLRRMPYLNLKEGGNKSMVIK